MKSFFKLLTVVFILTCFVASCKKETKKKTEAFEAKFKTWFRVSPTTPMTIVINGANFTGFAYFPGSGTGQASVLGNSTFYFNQLVYATTPDAIPTGSVAAPVVDILKYPVTGEPLAKIQAGDFASLASAAASLKIPTEVNGKIVNSVFLNSNNEAIYTSSITGSGTNAPLSATLMGFNGKALIVGGTGKFKNASGEFDYNGYFNITDAQDAEYNAKGSITY